MTNRKILAIVLGAFALLLILFIPFMFSPAPYANAAPLDAPTPVSINHSGVRSDVVTFYSRKAITADGNTGFQNLADHSIMDLQWVIDQGTVNTNTLKLQISNDGLNWVDLVTFVTANAADVNSMQEYAVFGRYARVNADVSNSNPLTLTVIGVAK